MSAEQAPDYEAELLRRANDLWRWAKAGTLTASILDLLRTADRMGLEVGRKPPEPACKCGATWTAADCPKHGDPAALTAAARPSIGTTVEVGRKDVPETPPPRWSTEYDAGAWAVTRGDGFKLFHFENRYSADVLVRQLRKMQERESLPRKASERDEFPGACRE